MSFLVEKWIDKTNYEFSSERRSCSEFSEQFAGFYTPEFLERAFYVVVEDIPEPDSIALESIGLTGIVDEHTEGITYGDTYYIKPKLEHELRLHFHELVHVVQWKELTKPVFIDRYARDLKSLGYDDAPLEKMAYFLQACFENDGPAIDVEQYVKANL